MMCIDCAAPRFECIQPHSGDHNKAWLHLSAPIAQGIGQGIIQDVTQVSPRFSNKIWYRVFKICCPMQCSAQGIQQGKIQDITLGIEQAVIGDKEQVPSRYQIMYPVGYRHGINQGIAKDIAEVLPKVYIAKYITFSFRGESSTYHHHHHQYNHPNL